MFVLGEVTSNLLDCRVTLAHLQPKCVTIAPDWAPALPGALVNDLLNWSVIKRCNFVSIRMGLEPRHDAVSDWIHFVDPAVELKGHVRVMSVAESDFRTISVGVMTAALQHFRNAQGREDCRSYVLVCRTPAIPPPAEFEDRNRLVEYLYLKHRAMRGGLLYFILRRCSVEDFPHTEQFYMQLFGPTRTVVMPPGEPTMKVIVG